MENSKENKPQGRSNPGTESAPNPAKMFIQWKSKNAQFSYYDKESKEDVLLKKPFTFIPLCICSTLKGYNHKKEKTYISNEVKNLKTDKLTVISFDKDKKRKTEWEGLYGDIKENLDQNVKFTVSLYAGIKSEEGKLNLVNLQLNGAGLHHWFDFTKNNDIWKNAVKSSKTTDEKNGDVKYKAPVYEAMKISEEMDIEAGFLQKEVEDYLKEYFAKNNSSESKVDENQENGLNDKSKADKPKSESKSTKKDKDLVVDEDDDDDENAPF